MDLGLFETIAYQLRGKTERMDFHLLGDPLKNREFLLYLQIAEKTHHQVEIVTSGYYLRNWKFSQLLASPIVQLNISLSAYSDPCNPKTRDYLQSCLELAKFHQSQQSKCFLNFRMHQSRIDPVLIQQFCEYFGVKDVFDRGRIRLGSYLFLRISRDFEWIHQGLIARQTNKFCHGLISQIGVLANGDVVPCCIDCDGGIVLGNLKDQSLDEILATPLAQNIVQGFQRGEAYHPQCQRCTYPAQTKMD
ncbi:SPASM domain-containing protein [Helicobacter pametensis]|uniref:SPASM domain-containing protein n=1 Tax=Helicobacter pametensis TaxID=95149 RepID=UPI0004BA7EE8|nr:SPASM domain-containing protein [Helicobacter pametensis]